jgi:hypothetical protein
MVSATFETGVAGWDRRKASSPNKGGRHVFRYQRPFSRISNANRSALSLCRFSYQIDACTQRGVYHLYHLQRRLLVGTAIEAALRARASVTTAAIEFI